MLDISIDDIDMHILTPLGMHLIGVSQVPQRWMIADKQNNLVMADNEIWQWTICYNNEKSFKKDLCNKIKTFKIVKLTIAESSRYEPGKVTYVANPLYKAKSLEEAKIRLDLAIERSQT